MAVEYCPTCGMRANGAFCGNCGTRLGEATTPIPAGPPPPAIRPTSPPNTFSPYADRQPTLPPPPPSRRGNGLAILLAALLGAAVLGIVLFASGLLKSDDHGAPAASPGRTATSSSEAGQGSSEDSATAATASTPVPAGASTTATTTATTTTEEALPWPGGTDAPPVTSAPTVIRDQSNKECRPTGETVAGYPVAACKAWQAGAAMWEPVSLAKGSIDVVCQRNFPSMPNPQYTAKQANTWWFWAQAGGTWDWFPETALSEGGSNAPVGQVAMC